MAVYKEWDKVLYVPEWSQPADNAGEPAVVRKVLPLNGSYTQYYAIRFPNGTMQTVGEKELRLTEEYIYRWVGERGPSSRTYRNKGTAKGQATANGTKKIQRARVIWEDV